MEFIIGAAIAGYFIHKTADLIKHLSSEIGDLLREAIKAGVRVIKIVVNGVVHIVRYLTDGVVAVVNTCGETIRHGVSKLTKLLQKAFEAGAGCIKFIIDGAVRIVKFLANGVVQVCNAVGKVLVSGKVKVDEFAEFIERIFHFGGSHSQGYHQ